MKKYILTDIIDDYYDMEWHVKLHRIQAVMSFGDVKAGDFGGYVQSESNLSQEGNCWIYHYAAAWGDAAVKDNASIKHRSRIYGSAIVCDNAKVSGYCDICDNAIVADEATIDDSVKICGNAIARGHANVIECATMSGNAQALGHTTITNNASVSGNAILDGYITVGKNANISGDAKIYIAADIHDDAEILNQNHVITISNISDFLQHEDLLDNAKDINRITFYRNIDDTVHVVIPTLFHGELTDSIQAVFNRYGNSKQLQFYRKACDLARAHINLPSGLDNGVNRLKYYREVAGFSRAEASRQSGVSLRTLEDWESGKRIPQDVDLLQKLAKLYGCYIEDLIGGNTDD